MICGASITSSACSRKCVMRKNGTIIIISHQERIIEIADRIIVVSGGTITGTGTKDEILPGLLKESNACRYYREEVRI